MKKLSKYQLITIFFTLLTIVVNGLANALPLNGQSTGEISDRFAIYFVPAGYVFSIWGLIYAGLIAFTIFQALPPQRGNPIIKKISPAYWGGSIANTLWIFLWHYEQFLFTLIVMIAILASLLVIYLAISKQRSGLNKMEKLLVALPFSVYLGWISVAIVANASQVLFFFGWNGFGLAPEIWTMIMLAVAGTLGLLMLLREKDVAYAAVLVWAFIGIASKHALVPSVSNTAWAVTVVLIVGSITTIFLPKKSRSIGA
jgi:translocator protein